MSSIKIYDSEGTLYRDGSATNEVDEEIAQYFTSGIRLAVQTGRRYTATVFFRASETAATRSNQFYASYTVRELNRITNLPDEVSRVVEDEWGYQLDIDADDLDVFRQLSDGGNRPPGSETDRKLLQELFQGTRTTTVGVGNASSAIGLLSTMSSSVNSAAISTSRSGDAFSMFDLVTVVGRYDGIEPIGDTERDWERARDQVRDQVLSAKVSSIQDDVRELKQEWGYDDGTIRQRVTSQVPALSQPTSYDSGGTGGSLSSSGSLGNSSKDDQRKTMFVVGGGVALVALLLLVGGSVAGFGPLAGGGGDVTATPSPTVTTDQTPTPSPTVTTDQTPTPTTTASNDSEVAEGFNNTETPTPTPTPTSTSTPTSTPTSTSTPTPASTPTSTSTPTPS